jgi:S1-C subfamily serine protease
MFPNNLVAEMSLSKGKLSRAFSLLLKIDNDIDTRQHTKSIPIYKDVINNKSTYARKLLCDFNNPLPDLLRINRGIGFIKTYMGSQYVITVNHVIINFAKKYVAYCKSIADGNIITFNLELYKRIPEIDIVIMKITSKHMNHVPELCIDLTDRVIYDNIEDNVILTGEYDPNTDLEKCEKTLYDTIKLNTSVEIMFGILKSKLILDFPVLDFNVSKMSNIKDIIKSHRIDFEELKNKKESHLYRDIVKDLTNRLKGISGSIVNVGGKNIGMVSLFASTNNGFRIKAIPLFLIDNVVKNIIGGCADGLVGIQINTHGCDIEYANKNMFAHYVINQSFPYINGKKLFCFNKGDVILNIDNMEFNEKQRIFLHQLRPTGQTHRKWGL